MSTNSTSLAIPVDEELLFSVVAEGNLAKLNATQKLAYYNRRCTDLGLNPLNQPFQWLMLQGKLTLYANRQCTEELRKIHGVSITKVDKERFEDIYVVTAYARDRHGREDSSTGAVNIGGLKGEVLANACMKAETKAKRRVTLSICGLGMLDETEVETIPGAIVNPKNGETLEESAANYDKKNLAQICKCEGWALIAGRITAKKENKGHLWFDLNGIVAAGDPKRLRGLDTIELGDEAEFGCIEQADGKKKFYAIQEIGVVTKHTNEEKLTASVEVAPRLKELAAKTIEGKDEELPF